MERWADFNERMKKELGEEYNLLRVLKAYEELKKRHSTNNVTVIPNTGRRGGTGPSNPASSESNNQD